MRTPSPAAVRTLCGFILLCATSVSSPADDDVAPAPQGWPEEFRTVRYRSPADDSMQPAVFFAPESSEPVPLLVSLHSWSGGYAQPNRSRADWCIKHRWAFVAPDFRGPNQKPQACGSESAVADITAAVEEAKKRTKIDPDRIYLIGASGGGYAAMLLAGRHPEIWAGVSAWCGIADLTDWHRETSLKKLRYARDIEQCCGGPPGIDAAIDEQYRRRSAVTWIQNAENVPLDLNHGIHDGHKGSVPVSHSIKAFNRLAPAEKRITEQQTEYFLKQRKPPETLRDEKIDDPAYGKRSVLFRRISQATRLTIFDGAHEAVESAGLSWLSRQNKRRPARWEVESTGSPPAEVRPIDH